jgi:lysine 2,3-aminomutase
MTADPQNRRIVKTARSSKDLVELGLIKSEDQSIVNTVSSNFTIAIPLHLVELIGDSVSEDPIARQFVPSPEELEVQPAELADPIGDDRHTPVRGITHRYPDRLLLKPVHVCPVYCRFCFRRETVGKGSGVLSLFEMGVALDYIKNHTEVWEVILSGGDPLILSDSKLIELVRSLHTIPHVEVIRIHTRYPVAGPSRITNKLAEGLRGRAALYVVLHCNHARELTEEATAGCSILIDNGIPMLSQSVLLAGVNDDLESFEELMRALVRRRIKPYYLHHLDLARGTHHFRVTIERGQQLMRLLRGRLSGLCQPTYVLDIPGGHGKVPIGPIYVHRLVGEDVYLVQDYRGIEHQYEDQILDN